MRVAHYSTFVYGRDASYLQSLVDDVISDDMTLWSSLALSRGNYGLKAYMLLRAFGREKYRRIVQQNIDDIGYLASLIETERARAQCIAIPRVVMSMYMHIQI